MSNYRKTMTQAMREMYPLTEAGMSSAQIAQLKKAYEPMRGKKISTSNATKLQGIMDKFAKSKDVLLQLVKADIPFVSSAAVTRLISKHGMKGAEINKLKKEEMEFWAEWTELDEGRERSARQLVNPNKEVMVVKKNKVVVIDKKDEDKYLKQGWSLAEEVELDEQKFDVKTAETKKGKITVNSFANLEAAKKYLEYMQKRGHKGIISQGGRTIKEEVEIDEAIVLAKKGNMKVVNDDGEIKLMKGSKVVSSGDYDRGAGVFFMGAKQQSFDSAEDILKMKEDVDLDEGPFAPKKVTKKERDSLEDKNEHGLLALKLAQAYGTPNEVQKVRKINRSHENRGHITHKDQKERDAISNKYYNMAEEYGRLRGKINDIDEASASADARRHARGDKDLGRRIDPADVDTDATDDDVKAASKNIIMQMRKAVSMRGNFKVEFGDKKKVKIPAKVAQAVQDKYNSLKKPADKEKFQAQVAKSYKDMLRVIKAGYHEEVDLDENKVGKDGKIHMSKKDYAKKPKEYKGKRNGKPTLMALDPKSGATTSFEVVFEEDDMDEAKKGLWHNIHQKRKSGEKMRKKGDPGAPSDADIKKSQEEVDIDERILKFCNDVVDELKEDALVKSGKDKKIGPSQVFNKRIIDRIDNKIKENKDG